MLLTVDTGGTKTLVTGFDRNGKPTHEYRFATPRNVDEYLGALSELIHDNFRGRIFDAVVIAVPGVVKNNIALWCDNLGWRNVDIATHLQPLVNCPIWLENDANLAGLAETRALELTPRTSLYVTISTGIGTGVIIDGRLSEALSASESGHMALEYDGTLQPWEEFASGSAIKETYGKFARDIHNKRTWHEIAEKISRGFLVLIPALQPDVIIIGGSIGTFYDQYATDLKHIVARHLPPEIPVPPIRQAKHPQQAVLYGCYYYGLDRLAARS